MASRFKQDMPPAGGYGPIEWAKKIPKPGMSGYALFATMFGFGVVGWTQYVFYRRNKRKIELEMREGRIALEPFMHAEQQRMFLAQLRKNRDSENELMKDVPGWVTGTLFGEPLYHNLANRFPIVPPEEYYAHCRGHDMYDRMYEGLKH